MLMSGILTSSKDAIAEYQKARQLNDDPWVLALLGHVSAATGRRDEALKILEQLKQISKQRFVGAYGFALVYAGLGDKDQAFQWLEKSYQDREARITKLTHFSITFIPTRALQISYVGSDYRNKLRNGCDLIGPFHITLCES